MKFIFAELTIPLTFADVKYNQFFVSKAGSLWQKINSTSANLIADPNGCPDSDCDPNWADFHPISRILPTVIKIEF